MSLPIMQIPETLLASGGEFDPSTKCGDKERSQDMVQGSSGRFLNGWCCGPAPVNDFLKWRPGPTLCGNQQSRSQNARREEEARMRAAVEGELQSGGTVLY